MRTQPLLHVFLALSLVLLVGCPTPPQMATVPSVAGMTLSEARAALAAVGLTSGAVTEQFNDNVPTGKVISQSPTAGEEVAAGIAVALVLSKGRQTQNAAVPNVVGMQEAAAKTTLSNAGFTTGTITRQFHAMVPAGVVLSQSPGVGVLSAPGSKVALTVSKGPQPVAVPNVFDISKAAAEAAIKALKLSVGTITEEQHDDIVKGNVIRQDPLAGVLIAPGTPVNLVISLGTPYLKGAEYMPATPGAGIRYLVSDNRQGAFQGYCWGVFQNSDGSDHVNMVMTLNPETGDTGNSLGGKTNANYLAREFIAMTSAAPAVGGALAWIHLAVPRRYLPQDSYTFGRYNDTRHTLTTLGAQTIGGALFPECIRVDVDASTWPSNDSGFNRTGAGYFIYAKGIGVAEMSFNRSVDDTAVTYTYVESAVFPLWTISGQVTLNGVPLAHKLVQLHNTAWGIRSETTSQGMYSLSARGPELVLRVGDDADADGTFEFFTPWPKTAKIGGLTGDSVADLDF